MSAYMSLLAFWAGGASAEGAQSFDLTPTQYYIPRRKHAIALVVSGAFAAPFVPSENITVDKWFNPLSEPAHRRHQHHQFISAPVLVSEDVSGWYAPFSEPRRFRVSISQKFIAQDVLSDNQLIDTFESRWHQPWSEPTRRKGLRTSIQQSTVHGSVPTPVGGSIEWYAPFSDPMRRLWRPTTQTAYFANPETPAPTAVFLEWHNWFSDPVRAKAGLRPDLQAVISSNIEPIIPSSQSWFGPYSEPLRLSFKIGLKAWLQQFFAADTETPPPPPLTIILSATETNGDIFTGAIFVTDEPPPFTEDPYALVSIVEVESGDGRTPTSIIES